MNEVIDNILEEISKYPLNDKELILYILKKRLSEEKRELIYKDYQKAMKDYENGKVKSGSVDDLFKTINEV